MPVFGLYLSSFFGGPLSGFSFNGKDDGAVGASAELRFLGIPPPGADALVFVLGFRTPLVPSAALVEDAGVSNCPECEAACFRARVLLRGSSGSLVSGAGFRRFRVCAGLLFFFSAGSSSEVQDGSPKDASLASLASGGAVFWEGLLVARFGAKNGWTGFACSSPMGGIRSEAIDRTETEPICSPVAKNAELAWLSPAWAKEKIAYKEESLLRHCSSGEQ